jgi:hypothetical protein
MTRDSNPGKSNSDRDAIAEAKRMFEEIGEPEPADVASYRKRVGEIIARAMRSFQRRRGNQA